MQQETQALTLKEVREKLRLQWQQQQQSVQKKEPKILFKPEQQKQ